MAKSLYNKVGAQIYYLKRKKYKSFPGGSSRSLGWNESDHDYENISAALNRSNKFLKNYHSNKFTIFD